MKPSHNVRRRIGALSAVAGFASLAAFMTFSGTPKWPLSGGFHYVVDLRPGSFATSSVWDNNAQWALSDWRDIGATGFRPGFTRLNTDYNNHGDGRNAWVWLNRPTDGWLGVTFVRWSGSTMKDCDIWYNSRPDYSWTNGLVDPCADRPYWPVDFRSVARHEVGHAIGLDHNSTQLASMNPIYDHAVEPHAAGSGLMPHADDKAGGRFLYPGGSSVTNVMATCWREPSSGSGQPRRLTISGSYATGNVINVPLFLENQSSLTVLGGASGIRVGIYLSTNNIISTGDTKIAEYTFNGNWPAHASGFYSLGATIPASTLTGTYHVGAIFDSSGLFAEQFETDNSARIGQISITNHKTGTLTTFGTGCARSGSPLPVISATAPGSEPNIGTSVTYRLANARANAPVVLIHGLSRTFVRGKPLPLNLSAIGMTGCSLYVSDNVTLGTSTNASGVATRTLPIPNNRSLIGVHAYDQWVIIDASANALGVATSNAMDTLVGGNL